MTETIDELVTFREPAYALFNPTKNGVMTTEYGNLAIFSTRAMAEYWKLRSKEPLEILMVQISRIAAH